MKGTFKSEFEKPADSPGFLLWQVSNLWQRKQREALKELDLTHAQFVLLASLSWLEQWETPITQVQLAHLTQVDTMMTSQILRTLEKKGLVQRFPHPTDTRANQVHITRKGNELVEKALPVVEKVDRLFFAPLNGEDVQLVQLFQRLLVEP